LSVVVVGQLLVGVAAVGLSGTARRLPHATVGAVDAWTPRPGDSPALSRVVAASAAAIRSVLSRRAAAVLAHNRYAFLADLDPAPTAALFRFRQSLLFDDLTALPLRTWSYELAPEPASEQAALLDGRQGRLSWSSRVTLRYAFDGFDHGQSETGQRLTFGQRGTRWFLANAAELPARAPDLRAAPWDGGRLSAWRGTSTLVLGHKGSGPSLATLGGLVDDAVRRVTALWGSSWTRQVVVFVPATSAELARLVGGSQDLSRLAAVTLAEVSTDPAGHRTVTDRIVINPAAFGVLAAVGRRVVLTHEVMHVASRASTGPFVPTWMVEGLADYAGYQGVDLPVATVASELQGDLRHGRVPRALPQAQDFDGGNLQIAQVYEQSWLAVRYLAQTYGVPALLRLYRAVGKAPHGDSGWALDHALRMNFGTTQTSFTQAWLAAVHRELG
jgi:hypothetical protein